METTEEDPPSLSPLSDVIELPEEDVTDSEDFSAFERRINAEQNTMRQRDPSTDSEDFSAFERRIKAEEEEMTGLRDPTPTDSEDFSAFERKLEEERLRQLENTDPCKNYSNGQPVDEDQESEVGTVVRHVKQKEEEPSDTEDFSEFERRIAEAVEKPALEFMSQDRSEGGVDFSTTSGIDVYEEDPMRSPDIYQEDEDDELQDFTNTDPRETERRVTDSARLGEGGRWSAEPTEPDQLDLESSVLTCDEVLSDTRSRTGTPRPLSRDPVLDQFFLDMDTFLEEEDFISPSTEDNQQQNDTEQLDRRSRTRTRTRSSSEDSVRDRSRSRSSSDHEYKPDEVKDLLEDITDLHGYKHEERVLKIIEKLTYCMSYLVDLNKQIGGSSRPQSRHKEAQITLSRESLGGGKTSNSDDEFYLVQNNRPRSPGRRRSSSALSYPRNLESPDPNAALEDQIKACLTNATSLEMLLSGPSGPVTRNKDLSKSLPNMTYRPQGKEVGDLSLSTIESQSKASSGSSLQVPGPDEKSGEVDWSGVKVPDNLGKDPLTTPGVLNLRSRPFLSSNSEDTSTPIINDDETGRRANEKLKEVMRIKKELEDCVKLSISLEDLIVDYAEKNEIPNMRPSNANLSVSMPDVRMKNSISDLSRPQGKKSKWGSEELPRAKRYRKRLPQEQNYTSSDSYYQSNPLGRKRRSRLSPDSISSSSISDGETYRRNVHKLDYPKNLVPFSPLGLEATSKLVRFKKLTTPTTSSVSTESLPQIGLVIESSRSSPDSPPLGPPIPVETPSYSSQDISQGYEQEVVISDFQPENYPQSRDNERRTPRVRNLRRSQVARDDQTSDCLNTLDTSDGDGKCNTTPTDSPKVSTVESEVMTVEMAVSPIEELRQLSLSRHPTIEYVNRATSPIVEVVTRPNLNPVETRALYTSSYSQTDSKDSNTPDKDVAQYFTKSSQNSTLETNSSVIPTASKDSESQTAPPTRSSKGTSTKSSTKVNTLGPTTQPAIVKTLSKNSVSESEKSRTATTQTVSSELPAENLRDIQRYANPVTKKRNHHGNKPRTKHQPQTQVLFCRKHMKSSPHKPSKTTYKVNKRRRKPEKPVENQYNTVTYHVNKTPQQPHHPRERISSSTSNNKTGDEGDSTLNFSTNFFTLSPEPGHREKGEGGEGDVVSSILLVPNSPDPLKGGEVWEKIGEELSPSWSDSCDYVDTTSDPSSLVDRKYIELMRRFSKNTAQEKRLLLNLFEDLGLSEMRCARLLNAIRRTGPMT